MNTTIGQLMNEYNSCFWLNGSDSDFFEKLTNDELQFLQEHSDSCDAKFLYALASFHGHKTLSDAENILRELAEGGYTPAKYQIGDLFFKAGKKNVNRYIVEAADAGYAPALFRIGLIMLLDGDRNSAEKYFSKAAKSEYVPALINLGTLYQQTGEFKDAFKVYFKAAEKGSPEAMLITGEMYENGIGVKQDVKKAVIWYGKASKSGIQEAEIKLERIEMHKGARSLEDSPNTFRKIKEMALAGNVELQFELAECYYTGTYVQQNYDEALVYYTMAANHGHVKAKSILGEMYTRGQGTEEDLSMALKYFLESANEGWPISMLNTGIFYLMGYGVTPDKAEAIKWFRKLRETREGKALLKQSAGIKEMHDILKEI